MRSSFSPPNYATSVPPFLLIMLRGLAHAEEYTARADTSISRSPLFFFSVAHPMWCNSHADSRYEKARSPEFRIVQLQSSLIWDAALLSGLGNHAHHHRMFFYLIISIIHMFGVVPRMLCLEARGLGFKSFRAQSREDLVLSDHWP
jgi:hypothetical protein